MNFNILQKPPPENDQKGWYRWFYRVCEILNALTPYGNFYDMTSQYVSANTPTPITFNTTDGHEAVKIDPDNTSHVICEKAGVYNFQFSTQFRSTSNARASIIIWPAVDGSAVPDSATEMTIASKFDVIVASWNFVIKMQAGQYFELIWQANDNKVYAAYTAANGAVPAIPSIILTVTKVGT